MHVIPPRAGPPPPFRVEIPLEIRCLGQPDPDAVDARARVYPYPFPVIEPHCDYKGWWVAELGGWATNEQRTGNPEDVVQRIIPREMVLGQLCIPRQPRTTAVVKSDVVMVQNGDCTQATPVKERDLFSGLAPL